VPPHLHALAQGLARAPRRSPRLFSSFALGSRILVQYVAIDDEQEQRDSNFLYCPTLKTCLFGKSTFQCGNGQGVCALYMY
jgi:hypothetical protein